MPFSPDLEGPPCSSAASSGSNQFPKYKLTMKNPTVTPAKSNPGSAPTRASLPPPPAASSQDSTMFVERELKPPVPFAGSTSALAHQVFVSGEGEIARKLVEGGDSEKAVQVLSEVRQGNDWGSN